MREVLVVDDHPIVLDAMSVAARSLFPHAGIRTATTLAGAIEAARAEAIDLALLDLGLPDGSGLPVLTAFREACPDTPVVVFSAAEDRAIVLAALQAGARGFLPKSSKPDVISAALRLIAAGGTYVPMQALGGEAGSDAKQETPAELTGRQLDVLRLMAQGLANKQIARELRIAHDTVKNHARALYAALGVQTRKDAARAAEQRGIKLD